MNRGYVEDYNYSVAIEEVIDVLKDLIGTQYDGTLEFTQRYKEDLINLMDGLEREEFSLLVEQLSLKEQLVTINTLKDWMIRKNKHMERCFTNSDLHHLIEMV